MGKTYQNIFVGFFILGMSLLVMSCGSGSGSSCGFSDPEAVTVDADGAWDVTESAVSGTTSCNETKTYAMTIAVSGNTATITREDLADDSTSGGGVFNGEISANQIKYNGSFGEDGGTNTINCVTLNVADSSSSFTGTSTWTFNNGTFCSGTSTFTGTKR